MTGLLFRMRKVGLSSNGRGFACRRRGASMKAHEIGGYSHVIATFAVGAFDPNQEEGSKSVWVSGLVVLESFPIMQIDGLSSPYLMSKEKERVGGQETCIVAAFEN